MRREMKHPLIGLRPQSSQIQSRELHSGIKNLIARTKSLWLFAGRSTPPDSAWLDSSRGYAEFSPRLQVSRAR